jgi:hypothetical protein
MSLSAPGSYFALIEPPLDRRSSSGDVDVRMLALAWMCIPVPPRVLRDRRIVRPGRCADSRSPRGQSVDVPPILDSRLFVAFGLMPVTKGGANADPPRLRLRTSMPRVPDRVSGQGIRDRSDDR